MKLVRILEVMPGGNLGCVLIFEMFRGNFGPNSGTFRS
jgi:hypothetical protein